MVRKHIKRDWSSHIKSTITDIEMDQHITFECFSFDPNFTKVFSPYHKNLTLTSNAKQTSWNSAKCYRSNDLQNDMTFTIPFSVLENGEYRIDILYEKSNYLCQAQKGSNYKKYDTDKNLVGNVGLSSKTTAKSDGNVLKTSTTGNNPNFSNTSTPLSDEYNDKISFIGENNFLKRITKFYTLSPSNNTLTLSIPHNCYFYGVVVRKQHRYWGDNNDSAGSELLILNASFDKSNMIESSELKVSIGFDDDFECLSNPSGFYMDYYNECNLIVKDDNGNEVNVFGGYLSSIQENSDRTQIDIHCADRLIDGQSRYILDELVMQKGDTSLSENDYNNNNEKSFDTYPQLLKYLCNSLEVTLKSSIAPNYLNGSEKYRKGVSIDFSQKKAPKKMKVSNGVLKQNKKSILVRNNSSGKKKQVWTIYNAKDNAKTPREITSYPFMHMVYGLGAVKKENKSETTETVANVKAGAVKFNKCGVSSNKKYVMGIGMSSSGKDKKPYGRYYRGIYKNKCPYCKSEGTLRWDSCRSNSNCINGKTKRNFPVPSKETEITCIHCDCDYSIEGNEKMKPWRKLTRVSLVESNKSEQDRLHNGKMEAVLKGTATVSSDSIWNAIWKIGKQYTYDRGASSTYSGMKKTGKGDCHAFADMIFTELKKYKVNCKIVEYSTSASNVHRSVMYKNSKNKWVNYPYSKHNWNKNVIAYSGASHPKSTPKKYTAGGTISQAKTSTSTSSTQTSTVTTTNGYDKDKPFQAYIKLTYSTANSWTAKKYNLYLDFTQIANSDYRLSGLKGYWINNTTRKTSSKNIVEFLRSYHGENARFFLHTIQLIAPAIKKTKDNDSTDWYTYDKSTHDNASCKMDLYQIVFDNEELPEPSSLSACGKSILDVMKTVVEDTGYMVSMTYGTHRCDDIINFKVDNQITASFEAHEGDENNILEWSSISYKPVSDLFNRSLTVFKGNDLKYHYVDTRDMDSIFNYHEQSTLQTMNEQTGEKEAYFNAINSDKYNPSHTYSYTITVPNYPNLNLGEYVKVVANSHKLNTLKTIESIGLEYSIEDMPHIRTKLGLGELSPDLQLKKALRNLRKTTKKETTSFSSTAIPVINEDVYEWDT